ncbi:MAG: PqqD family protein [Pseudomonadota bacterium]|nr:MAG: PqqD family protein [Pseudomonadota bacterium]
MSFDRIRRAFADGRLTANPLDDGSGVVLDTAGERLLTMNATGMALVQAIEAGTTDEAALTEVLTSRFEVDQERALADLRQFVERLVEALN